MLKVLDLFSGIGGFSLGLEKTEGFETVAFCEIDKNAQKVLSKHWPSVPIFEDVSTLSSKDFNGTIDIICGGFPCQDISLAGRGAGLEGNRSGLWFQFARLIEEFQPKYAIIENVSALRSRGLDQVLRSLAEIGYDAEWHCIPASALGAPHRRDRVWIIAYPRIQDGTNPKADAQCTDANSIGSHRASVYVEGSIESRDKQVSYFGSVGEVLANTESFGIQGLRPSGPQSHTHMLDRRYLCAQVKDPSLPTGKLNPTWVEWLMGFPAGWTDLSNSATQ